MHCPLKRSELEDGAATLMMRRLPEDWGAQRILEWLRENEIKLSQMDLCCVCVCVKHLDLVKTFHLALLSRLHVDRGLAEGLSVCV